MSDRLDHAPRIGRAAAAGDLLAFFGLILIVLVAGEAVRTALGLPASLAVALWGALPAAAVLLAGTTWLIRRRGGSWRALGLVWKRGAGRLLLETLAVMGAVYLLLLLSRPLLDSLAGGGPDIGFFGGIEGSLGDFLLALLVVWTAAAVGEELLFRGFLLDRLAHLLGGGGGAWLAAALLQGLLFGAAHAYQGLAGMWLTGAMGCIFGLAYLAVGRSLVPLILAHGLIDTLSLFQIFRGGIEP